MRQWILEIGPSNSIASTSDAQFPPIVLLFCIIANSIFAVLLVKTDARVRRTRERTLRAKSGSRIMKCHRIRNIFLGKFTHNRDNRTRQGRSTLKTQVIRHDTTFPASTTSYSAKLLSRVQPLAPAALAQYWVSSSGPMQSVHAPQRW